jgi:hypothetical protein
MTRVLCRLSAQPFLFHIAAHVLRDADHDVANDGFMPPPKLPSDDNLR